MILVILPDILVMADWRGGGDRWVKLEIVNAWLAEMQM